MRKEIIASCFILFQSFFADAELIIIKDYGGDSMTQYYDAINPQDVDSQIQQDFVTSESSESENLYLPIETTKMQPGYFDKIDINIHNLQPFVVVGYDDISIKWLIENKIKLENISNIVGIVVNVDSLTDLNYLRSLVDFQLYPMSGDDIADRLYLNHYPALFTSQSIEQ